MAKVGGMLAPSAPVTGAPVSWVKRIEHALSALLLVVTALVVAAFLLVPGSLAEKAARFAFLQEVGALPAPSVAVPAKGAAKLSAKVSPVTAPALRPAGKALAKRTAVQPAPKAVTPKKALGQARKHHAAAKVVVTTPATAAALLPVQPLGVLGGGGLDRAMGLFEGRMAGK